MRHSIARGARPLPRAILFDLDDTLIHAYRRPDLAWGRVTASHAEALAPHSPADIAAAIVDYAKEFWSDRAHHKRWRMQLFEARRRIVKEVLMSRGIAHSGEAIADGYTTLREAEMHLHPGAVETLEAFKVSGVKLALVTNGDGVGQRKKIERFGLAPHFVHIQIEGEHGFGKPEERAYLHALQILNVNASETWMVGDNLEWEVAAPQRLGIHAIWFDPEGEGVPAHSNVTPDRIITALPELVR